MPPRTPVPRIRGISDSRTGSVRRLINKNRRHGDGSRSRSSRSREFGRDNSSDDDSDGFSDRMNTFDSSASSLRSSRTQALRRGRNSSERKMEIIRDAFRHVCRSPTSKTHTLSEIRLEFGKPDVDGNMSVSSTAFRAALPRLLHIVNVSTHDLDLSMRDEEFIVEQIDLNRDGKITYAEFVNFITFSDTHLRQIARLIQSKIRNVHSTDASLRQLFDELATQDHRFLSQDKFRALLVQKLGVSLQPGELRSLVDLLDVDGNGQVRPVQQPRPLRKSMFFILSSFIPIGFSCSINSIRSF